MTPPDFASKTNEYITSYIVFADTKAGALLTFVTILGAAVGFAAPTVLQGAHAAHVAAYVVEWLAAGAVLVTVTMTLWNCLNALSPRMQPANSLHSFPDLAKKTPEQVAKEVGAITVAEVTDHLSRHNAALAFVANEKFKSLASAFAWLRWALLATMAVTYIYALSIVVKGGA
jgi:hypothetical protein